MIKILIGGSPCTYWSVAQKKGREVEAEGLGWELFRNYLIAKEKFKPDFFLYENNKSAAQPIKDQISHELGVDLMHINSALVSAQNRQRFYAFNWNVDQPADRGIMLKDILETTTSEKGYELRAPAVGVGYRNRREDDGKLYRRFETGGIPKGNALTTVQTDSMVAEPFNPVEGGKSHTLTASYGKIAESNLSQYGSEKNRQRVIQTWKGEEKPVYEVLNGEIEIKGKKYPIKLPDGLYIIRKLTPVECERLQTLPDGYTAAVSNTQRYKGLGNGWTAEVIIHILAGALKDVPRDEEIVVLSMYDGIGTGRYCLDKMGFTNVTYYAYEIDKPAMTVALSNYSDIIQLGDAFDLRRDDWELGKRFEHIAEQKAEAPESPEQTTDLSDAPEEIKEQIIENDRALKEKDDTAPTPLPEGFDVVDQLYELLAERKKLHIIDEENLRYNCDIIALEYAIGALRR